MVGSSTFGEYFLAELIMSADLFKKVVAKVGLCCWARKIKFPWGRWSSGLPKGYPRYRQEYRSDSVQSQRISVMIWGWT
jgi:hypothetical protein